MPPPIPEGMTWAEWQRVQNDPAGAAADSAGKMANLAGSGADYLGSRGATVSEEDPLYGEALAGDVGSPAPKIDPYAGMSNIEKLVAQTDKFASNISTGMEQLGGLYTSSLAGANTSASSANTGGSLFDKPNKQAMMSVPDYQSGTYTQGATADVARTPIDAPADKQTITGTGIDTWTPEKLDAAGYAQNPDGSVRYVGFPEGDLTAQGEVAEPKTPVVAPSDVTAKPTAGPLEQNRQTVLTSISAPQHNFESQINTILSDAKFSQALSAIKFDIDEGRGTYQDYDLRAQGAHWQSSIDEIKILEDQLTQRLVPVAMATLTANGEPFSVTMAEFLVREEVQAGIKKQLIGQGFSESEINVFTTEPGSRPTDIAMDETTMPAESEPQGQAVDATTGELYYFHNAGQYQGNTNKLTNLMTSARATTAGAPRGMNWTNLQKEVTKPMQLPPNYVVRTDSATGQVFIEWDFTTEHQARTGGITPPQRLDPTEERDIIASAQAYYTQLNRAQQLLTQHYESEFDMQIIDKELQEKAAELELQGKQLELQGKQVQISRDEFEAIYGEDGFEGKKFEAIYGEGGLERDRVLIEQDRQKLEETLRTDKLLLEAGKIIFSDEKARALGLVDKDDNPINEFTTLAADLQERTLAIQEAEMKGMSQIWNTKTGKMETILTAKQRNQHTVEAQQYANAQSEQSGIQHKVMLRSDFDAMGPQNRPGDLVGAYGEYLVVRTQTSTFAREQFGEAVQARKNAQAIETDRINADKEISRTMEQLRLTGISTEAATAQSIANTNAESAKAVAQLRLDAETQGIDNELTLLDRRIELEAQREGQTLTRQEIARQAEITMQIELSKQRIIEEAAQRGTELDDQIAERLATLQITKEIGTENSANALAQVNARMDAEKAMATEAVTSSETIALAQAAAKVTLSEGERADALARLTKTIEANATAQGLQLTREDARAEAQRALDRELAGTAGTQVLGQITAETAAVQERLQNELALEKQFADEAREALTIATDPTVVAQARQVASTFVANLNSALAQGTKGNFEQAATAMATELPPAPPGIAWDAALGRFAQRPGFEGRELSPATQEWISATTGAYKARDRAEQAIREGTRLRTESQLRESERQTADEDFRQAMLTSDIDTAEEAITRQRMAETRQLENQTKLDNLQMLFGLLANPVQLGFAKKHGLLGQIEAVLGFAIGNVPEAAIGPTIPNINEWQTMDSEQQAFSIANFVEQGGSPTSFMQMVQGAAPAQMQQVQYGVL